MILYFSGTGNSLMVAQRLAERLGDKAIDITSHEADTIDVVGDRVVWVFPVYSWGVPPIVVKRFNSITLCGAESVQHFAVMTCGDDVGNTHKQWRRMCRRRNWTAASAFSVIMPNTYVLMKGFDTDAPEVAEAKLAAAPTRIDAIATHIAAGDCGIDDVVRGRFAGFKSAVIYPWVRRYAMSPRPFRATDDCIGCGICARACPLHNITIKNRRPCWGDDCALCLRCYHICPRRSVAYGNATRGKSRYTAMLHLFNIKN